MCPVSVLFLYLFLKNEVDQSIIFNKSEHYNLYILTQSYSFQVIKEPSGLFMPFQVKENTRLAPEHRQTLSEDKINDLDNLLKEQVNCNSLNIIHIL